MSIFNKIFFLFVLLFSTQVAAMSELARKAYEELKQEDFASARKILEEKEAKDDPDALFLLGMMYDSGKGVEANKERAASLYLDAAKRGHSVAQLYVGIFYKQGISFETDIKKSEHWLSLSARAGNRAAQRNLGVLYSDGELADEEKAIYWLRKASNQGSTGAMGMLAAILAREDKNLPEAYAWSHLAAKYDPVQRSTSTRFVIEKYSTPEQISEGKRLMERFESELRK